jgi:hypothetical protein
MLLSLRHRGYNYIQGHIKNKTTTKDLQHYRGKLEEENAIKSLVFLRLQIDDEALSSACVTTTKDTPLGAKSRRCRRSEPEQRMSGCPKALESGGMTDLAADKTSERSSFIEVIPTSKTQTRSSLP